MWKNQLSIAVYLCLADGIIEQYAFGSKACVDWRCFMDYTIL